MSDVSSREGGLVAWQWSLYGGNHTARRNLVIHLVTVPIFMAGTLTALSAWAHWWLLPVGLGMMALAMAAQGRGHRMEDVPPVPFAGPLDVAGRIFMEQWVTFPRFVLSGRLAAAWSATAPRVPG